MMREEHMNDFFLNNYHRLGVPEEGEENYNAESLPVSLEMSYVDCLLWAQLDGVSWMYLIRYCQLDTN